MLLLLLVWLALVLSLTLTPVGGSPDATGWSGILCVVCGGRGTADGLLNIALFVPLGWAASRRWGRGAALAGALVLTLGIESVQMAIPGRHAAVGDVLANGLGAAVGAALAGNIGRAWPLFPTLAGVGVLAPLVLLQPAPPEAVYYGQWTPRLGHLAPYDGRVLDVRVGVVSVPPGRSARSEELRRELHDGGPIEVTFVVGPPPSRLAPVFSVFDHRQREVFLLGVAGTDLVVRRRTRAAALLLDSPELRWRKALDGRSVGDTVRFAAEPGATTYCTRLDGERRCDLMPRQGSGWQLLLAPDGWSRSGVEAVSVAWMVALGIALAVVPLGGPAGTALVLLLAGGGWALAAGLPHLTGSILQALGLAAGGLLTSRYASRIEAKGLRTSHRQDGDLTSPPTLRDGPP